MGWVRLNAPTLNTIQGASEPGAVEDGHLEAAIEWADSFEVDYVAGVSRTTFYANFDNKRDCVLASLQV